MGSEQDESFGVDNSPADMYYMLGRAKNKTPGPKIVGRQILYLEKSGGR